MVTVPAIVLGLLVIAGYALCWILAVVRTARVLRRMSRREMTAFLAGVDAMVEAEQRDDDDDNDQDGGQLQPVHAH